MPSPGILIIVGPKGVISPRPYLKKARLSFIVNVLYYFIVYYIWWTYYIFKNVIKAIISFVADFVECNKKLADFKNSLRQVRSPKIKVRKRAILQKWQNKTSKACKISRRTTKYGWCFAKQPQLTRQVAISALSSGLCGVQ